MGPYGPGSPSYAEWDLDLNGDGASDFLFSFATEAFLVSPHADNETVVTPGTAAPMSAVLPTGTGIGRALSLPLSWNADDQELVHWFGLLPDDMVCDGPWAGVLNQYLGASFDIDGQIHYAWVEISVSAELPYAILNSWAYETVPGQGIVAGAVPEPSSIMLFLLGLIVLFHRPYRLWWQREHRS